MFTVATDRNRMAHGSLVSCPDYFSESGHETSSSTIELQHHGKFNVVHRTLRLLIIAPLLRRLPTGHGTRYFTV